MRGDEKSFCRIHDEAQAVINGPGKDAANIKASPLWRKYRTTWERVTPDAVVGDSRGGAVLILAVMISSAIRNGAKTIGSEFNSI